MADPIWIMNGGQANACTYDIISDVLLLQIGSMERSIALYDDQRERCMDVPIGRGVSYQSLACSLITRPRPINLKRMALTDRPSSSAMISIPHRRI